MGFGDKVDRHEQHEGQDPDWGDDDDEAPAPPRTAVAWWKIVLVWLPAGIGVGIMLLGVIQLLPLLVAPDDGAIGVGPALFLVLLGGGVFGIALLVRWALGGALRR